jgi:hypothetical protein
MRRALRIGFACLGAMALAVTIGLAWLFFDSQRLPNMQSLARIAPGEKAQVADPCLNASSIAIPYEQIGNNITISFGSR